MVRIESTSHDVEQISTMVDANASMIVKAQEANYLIKLVEYK